jgi:D-glycero-D-manno-heptose 1,7-bisphosphate phosphatase
MRPAIFLDRDGVIIENCPNYVRSWEDVQIFAPAVAALTKLVATPYAVVLVTNQSAVGRGILSLEQAHSINTRLVKTIVQAGGRVEGVYLCPHAPADQCDCRKPRPGMFHQAAQELSLDLSQSMMIGDAYTDLLAGQRAGVGKIALVRTGRGAAQAQNPPPSELGKYFVYETLAEALDALLGAERLGS